MRKIVLGTVAMALIAASVSQAFAAQKPFAAQKQHHARKTPQATSEQSRNAIRQPTQPAWPYSGWSAPAGR